jgi:hypothetical protein
MKVLQEARIDLEATTRAVVAAHDGYGRDAIESVRWERRGLLQRLVRPGASEPETEATSDVPIAA